MRGEAAEVGPGSGTRTTELEVTSAGDTVTVNAGGAILPAAGAAGADRNGVESTADNVVVTNAGVISSAPDATGFTNAAILSSGNNLTVNNTGTLSGLNGAHGIYHYQPASTNLTVNNSGTISGFFGIFTYYTSTQLANSGTIYGNFVGVFSGGYYYANTLNLTNSGTITGGTGSGVSQYYGTLNLTNTGTISGGSYGVFLLYSYNGSIVNSGTISGGSASIYLYRSYYNSVILETGSNIIGNMYVIGGYGNTLTLDGSGTLNVYSYGFDTLTKTGAGTWTLTDYHYLRYGVNVNAGTLNLSGGGFYVYYGNTNIAAGATLSGNGYFYAYNTYVNGTIRPEGGNLYAYTYVYVNSGGNLSSIITSPATANQLIVNGALYFNPGSTIVPLVQPGSIARGTSGTVTIATATGGVVGTAPVAQTATVQATAIFNPNDVQLVFTSLFYRDVARTHNQKTIAGNLDQIWQAAAGYSNDPNNIGNLLLALDSIAGEAEFRRALDELNPEFYDALKEIQFSNLDAFVRANQRRLQQARYNLPGYDFASVWDRGAPSLAASSFEHALGGVLANSKNAATPEKDRRWSVTGLGFGHFGERDTQRSDAGLHRTGYEFQTGGFQFGFDYRLNKWATIGALVGFMQSFADVDQHDSEIDSDQVQFGPYVAIAHENFFVDAMLLYGHQWHDTRREVVVGGFESVLKADPDSDTLTMHAGGGYLFKNGKWTYGPEASLRYTKMWIDDFNERSIGAAAAALAIGERDVDSLLAKLGGRAAHEFSTSFGKIIPEVRASWIYEAFNDDREITARFINAGAGAFTIRADNPDRHAAQLGTGITLEKKNMGAQFMYDAQIGRPGEVIHSVNAGVRLKF